MFRLLCKQVQKRFELVSGASCDQLVNKWQRGLHAACQRLEAGSRGMGIDPYDLLGKPAEALHLRGQFSGITALPAVRGKHDLCAACHAAMAPNVEKGLYLIAKACAARPIGYCRGCGDDRILSASPLRM